MTVATEDAGAAAEMRDTPQSQMAVLRSLFLTLFLRGRSARGITVGSTPTNLLSKMWTVLLLYALLGLTNLAFIGRPVLILSVYVHAITLSFVGLLVASSVSELLFNKEENDILLHRPVTSSVLLWAKMQVLVFVTAALSFAFNLATLFVGAVAPDGGLVFPVAHTVSLLILSFFCVGSVVLVYQLCLRWLGRERLDGLMTTVQVLATIMLVVGSQLVPRFVMQSEKSLSADLNNKWMLLAPPAWFAGIDDVLAGSGSATSWTLALTGVAVTGGIFWLAFGALAASYDTALKTIGEAPAARARTGGGKGKFFDFFLTISPVRWWMRDSVSLSSFRLCAAYLMRDREIKLRVYPAIAPLMVIPLLFLFTTRDPQDGEHFRSFGIAFSATYLAMIPWQTILLLQNSQQWQAADIFRMAPITGPARIAHGARRAVLLVTAVPSLLIMGAIAWFAGAGIHLWLLLPGAIILPICAIFPQMRGAAVPLSLATGDAQGSTRGLWMILAMILSSMLAGLALAAWTFGLYIWFLLAELVVATAVYYRMRAGLERKSWPSIE